MLIHSEIKLQNAVFLLKITDGKGDVNLVIRSIYPNYFTGFIKG